MYISLYLSLSLYIYIYITSDAKGTPAAGSCSSRRSRSSRRRWCSSARPHK